MKRIIRESFTIIFGLAFCLLSFASIAKAEANANPTWNADEPVIFHGEAKPYDYYGAKDPTIVYYGGKYHVFYTGANQSGGWQMLYTSASTISGLKTAPRTFMSKIQESYFCAPQVFYFEPKGLWYLVYQDGTYGAAYSTTTNIGDPTSWSKPKSLGLSGNMGWDYYIVCDDTNAYIYNTPDDGSGKLYVRKTTLANFPAGWSAPSVAISNSFEGAHVYKSLADGKYYLVIEDQKDGRYYELWTSSSAGGPWKQVAEKWSWRGNLTYNGKKWTTNVSHGEIIRAGHNQKMEIKDINKVDFLIQGTTSLSGDYQKIIWDLGLIRNYKGSSATNNTTTNNTTNSNTTNSNTGTTQNNSTKVETRSALKTIEAEDFNSKTSSTIEVVGNSSGGKALGYIEKGNTITYKNIDFGSGVSSVSVQVGSELKSNIEIRLGSEKGTLIGTVSNVSTGGFNTYQKKTATIKNATGVQDIVLVFTGPVNLDSFVFTAATSNTTNTTSTTKTTGTTTATSGGNWWSNWKWFWK